MRIIFLDFDGVITRIDGGSRNIFARPDNQLVLCGVNIDQTFNRLCVERLARLTVATQASIVFSTTWRNAFSTAELCRMLRAIAPFPKECFAGVTPYDEGKRRGAEIYDWLKPVKIRHPTLDYVILDDAPHSEFAPEQIKKLVQTNPVKGLQPADVERAMAILRHRA